MPPLRLPLQSSKFSLDVIAVAGFFGGDEAISAMATVYLYKGRRWFGWFNSPGSYAVANRFSSMPSSRFWAELFRGNNDSPAVSLGFDGKEGPMYSAALSGITMPTGHLAYLTMKRSKNLDEVKIDGRVTKSCYVTYLALKHVDHDAPMAINQLPLTNTIFGLIPITVSVLTCVMCALVYDWISFSMILLGIVCNGWASFLVGKGRLVIKSTRYHVPGTPPGHGILKGEDVMVIKGKEDDVNFITKGRFDLEADGHGSVRNHIGFSSLLLLAQFVLQLLLIPQGHLFGQIMFLVSLIVSWVYNSHPSPVDREKIQTALLFEALGEPQMVRFCVGARTTMAVFICLLLFHGVDCGPLSKEEERKLRVKVLNSYLPNDTAVWRRWTDMVVDQLLNIDLITQGLPYLQYKWDPQLPESHGTLLTYLLDDAACAFRGYFEAYKTLPMDSTQY